MPERLARFEAATEKRFDLVDKRLDRLESDVGDLKGDSYERRVRERAPSLLNRVAGGMRRIRVLDTAGLADTLDDAVDSGSINADERDDLLRADCVARAVSRETAETVYLVVEAPVSLANDDMKRAARRAELASRALGATAIPVVVAASQSKAVRAGLAEIVLFPMTGSRPAV
jgi:hypothetical protein